MQGARAREVARQLFWGDHARSAWGSQNPKGLPLRRAEGGALRFCRGSGAMKPDPGVRRRRIASIEIACQTQRSGVNPRAPRPVKSGTRERGSDSDGGMQWRRDPFPSAPGEAFCISCAKDRHRTAETSGLGEHMRIEPDRHSRARPTLSASNPYRPAISHAEQRTAPADGSTGAFDQNERFETIGAQDASMRREPLRPLGGLREGRFAAGCVAIFALSSSVMTVSGSVTSNLLCSPPARSLHLRRVW